MNKFDVHALAYVLHEIARAETGCFMHRLGQPGTKPVGNVAKKGNESLEFAKNFFILNDLEKCLKATQHATYRWNLESTDASACAEVLNRLQMDIVNDLESMAFLRIETDRVGFVDTDDLFGKAVSDAFGSACQDIKEAGNCLAAECNTAAVFHLMRASEISLRALARDRDVEFKDKPLQQQEWGTILGSLEGKVKDLRLADRKNWTDADIKESQVRFYNDVLQELRGFNEAWRRHISHADPSAFYDHDDAANIWRHVKLFMQKLATKVSENKITPKYWTTA